MATHPSISILTVLREWYRIESGSAFWLVIGNAKWPFVRIEFAAEEGDAVEGLGTVAAKLFAKRRLIEAEVAGARQEVGVGLHAANDLRENRLNQIANKKNHRSKLGPTKTQ